MKIIRLKDESFDVRDKRYQLLFLFNNVYGVFRAKEDVQDYSRSDEYEIEYFNEHECITPDDVLKDIFYMVRSGEMILQISDVVSMKINGALKSYRYCGLKNHDPDRSYKNFVEIPRLFEKEINDYTVKLHCDNKVLSLLDGKVYSINSLSPNNHKLYCIEKETFKSEDWSAGINSEYSLYVLNDMDIKEMNPYPKPFMMISTALYYFFKNQRMHHSAILLLNRYEMEMIKDFYQLNQLVV